MLGPAKFADFLNRQLYHPRSDAHSNALCQFVLEDLITACPLLAHRAARGEIVASRNLTQIVGHDTWNIDLALGPPAKSVLAPEPGTRIRHERPAIIHMAMEAKGVMTEHGKARRNRLRDFHAFHEHAHRYDSRTVAVAVLAVNASRLFWSPTRAQHDITEHRDLTRLVKQTIDVFRSLPLREARPAQAGLEAFAVVVVEHDNLLKNPALPTGYQARPSRVVETPPAPPVGDPFHYSSMIYRTCDAYTARYS